MADYRTSSETIRPEPAASQHGPLKSTEEATRPEGPEAGTLVIPGPTQGPNSPHFPPIPSSPVLPPVRLPLHDRFFANLAPLWFQHLALYVLVVFTILYSLFIYRVLIVGDPVIGGTVFDFAATNLLLSILSQVYATLIGFVVQGLLDALKWSWATLGSTRATVQRRGMFGRGRGIGAGTFVQFSSATDWFSTGIVTAALSFGGLLGLIKLAVPFMILGFGSVLKVQNDADEIFIAQGPIVPVYAGTIPLVASSLNVIPTVYVAGYFDTWMQALLHYPRFVVPWTLESCSSDDECAAFMLPGSLEQVRRRRTRFLNETVLQGGLYDSVKNVRVEEAPGIVLKFEPVQAEVDFDLQKDCEIYGRERNDGIQFCRKQVGDSIAVGWRACPGNLYPGLFFSLCAAHEASWTAGPLRTKTLLTAYRQTVTTTYDRSSLEIEDVQAHTKASILPLDVNEHEMVWRRILVQPPPSPTNVSAWDDATSAVNTFLFRLPWLHRTYTEWYPDNHSIHLEHLRNFLAINMQFAVTALSYASYMDVSEGAASRHPLPQEMEAVAVGGRAVKRFVAQPWAAWTFIIAGSVITSLSALGYLWILVQDEPVPKTTGILEWDMVDRTMGGRAENSPNLRDGQNGVGETMTLAELIEGMSPKERSSTWQVAKALQSRRFVFVPGVDGGRRTLVVLRHPSEMETEVPGERAVFSRATTVHVVQEEEDAEKASPSTNGLGMRVAEVDATK